MALETYDWSTHYGDEDDAGTTTFTSGTGDAAGDTVAVTLTQSGTYRIGRDGFETNTQGGFAGGHFEAGVNFDASDDTVQQTIQFDTNTHSGANSVSDLSFDLYDIDSTSSGSFQDQVTVRAYDIAGVELKVIMVAQNGSVVSVVADGNGAVATAVLGAGTGPQNSVSANSSDGNVTVTVSGEVHRVVITYGNGPEADGNPANQVIGIGDLTFDLVPPISVCFVDGTLILTDKGEVPVENLKVGDLVMTMDNGLQQLRWAGSSRVEGVGKLAPIRFAKGAIGNDRPLHVSPQHRVLLAGAGPELLTGHDEVLATALHLVNDDTITQNETDRVNYYHLMFDRHEVVFANGAPCESLFLGARAIRALGSETLTELEALFPDLLNGADKSHSSTARYCLRRHEARLVA